MIRINIAEQTLSLQDDFHKVTKTYSISSAKNGVGEQNGSEKTPKGRHVICEKIGENMPILTVFSARKPTGERYSRELAEQFPGRDWILSRILWLAGEEWGVNLGGEVDTRSRFIYIHGTNDEAHIGTPNSHGCIRMCNEDVVDLFERVSVGESVYIF